MKGLKKIAWVASLLLLIPTTAFAGWHVRFVNNTSAPITIHVYGEHLFWQQEDATVKVGSNASADVEMPGGICATYFTFDYNFELNGVFFQGTSQKIGITWDTPGATCWNTQITIVQQAKGNLWDVQHDAY